MTTTYLRLILWYLFADLLLALAVTHASAQGLQVPKLQSALSLQPGEDIQAMLDSADGHVYLKKGTYRLGKTSLRMRTGSLLQCSSPANTVLIYEGTEAAIIFDSISQAVIEDCQIQLHGKEPAQGIRFQNTTGDNKWNVIRNVLVQNTASSQPIAGQAGLLFLTSTRKAMYWNLVDMFQALNLDIGVQLTNAGLFADNGSNDNTLIAISAHHCRTGVEISKHATENRIFGLSGSASGLAGKNTLLLVGDPSGTEANFNMVFGLVSDQGSDGQAWYISKGAHNTYVHGTDQSGVGPVDEGSNSVIERIGGGASTISVPNSTDKSSSRYASTQGLHAAIGCKTAARPGAACTGPEIPWGTPYRDGNYTATCSLSEVTGQPHIVGTHQSPTGISVTIANDTGESSTGFLSCVAVHQ